MATQRDIVAYLKCTINEDNLEFEKIHKMITKTINNRGHVEEHVVIFKQHECVMYDSMGKLQRRGDFCNGVQPQPFIPLEIVDPIFKTQIALEKCAFYKLSKTFSTSQMSITLFPSRCIASFIQKSSVLKFHHIFIHGQSMDIL